ncbi:Uncharacterized protein FKW44_010908 [Caligus rogercresseyi]|uniref:Uncharacterized protein n=1 Tax=Caligus rogercresseyi TaxID=217165 RepID=A0A7T8HHS8_CALRO|nr:Uncharacterized protein FKW44_010908 [Caligus rogercresseyi]
MWQVKVRHFQPESKNSQFTMTGVHRLCVTPDDVKFFPWAQENPSFSPWTAFGTVQPLIASLD